MHTTTQHNGRHNGHGISRVAPPIIAGRVPPHDLDVEAAVLSAVLLKRDAIEDVGDLQPEHFYSDSNGRIFEAALALHADRRHIDLVTVASWLRDRECLQQVGGASYLAQIVDASPAVAHLNEHAEIVVRKWRRRRAIAEAQLIAAEGYGDLDSEGEEAWLESLPERLREPDAERVDAVHIGTSIRRVWEERSELAHQGRARLGPLTGIVDLDHRIGGLRPGKLTTVGARSGVGKTALAFQVATKVATGGDGVLVFELEALEDECVDRLQYTTAGVDGSRLLAGERMSDDELRALTGAAVALERSPMWVVAKSGLTVSWMRSCARRLARALERAAEAKLADARRAGVAEDEMPKPPLLRVIVVDYAQLIETTDVRGATHNNREAQIAYVSRSLKKLAMDLGVHVMLLSQLNKDGDRRGEDKRPRTSDMRESSALENDSDHIVLIHNPNAIARSFGECDGASFDEVELILGKNRGGKPGTIPVQWWPSHQRYENVERRPWSQP